MGEKSIKIKEYCYMRALACMGIVLLHALTSGLARYSASLSVGELRIAWCLVNNLKWCLPCFILVSGALLLDPEKGIGYRRLFSVYLGRMLGALLLFGSIYSLLETLACVQAGDKAASFPATFFRELYGVFADQSWTHLWYLFCMIGLYLLLPFYKILADHCRKRDMTYLLIIYLTFLSILPFLKGLGLQCGFYIHVSTIYPFWFFYGFYLRKWGLRRSRSFYACLNLLSTAGLSLLTLVRWAGSVTALEPLFYYSSPLLVLQVTGLAGMLKYAGESIPQAVGKTMSMEQKKWQNYRKTGATSVLNRFLCRIDGHSFGIYLLHMIVLWVAYSRLKWNPFARGGFGRVVALAAAAFLFSLAADEILRQIPVFRGILGRGRQRGWKMAGKMGFFFLMFCLLGGGTVSVHAQGRASVEGRVSVEGSFDASYHHYALSLEGISLSSGEKLQIAVWSGEKGQDDLRWNPVTVQKGGRAELTIRIADYKSPGLFYAHVYKVSRNKTYTYLGGRSFTVPKVSVGELSLWEEDPIQGRAGIRISGLDSTVGIRQIRVPTWTNRNQSDIRWYPADGQADGSYIMSFNIADHGGQWARYNHHVYVTDGNGFTYYVGAIGSDLRLAFDQPQLVWQEENGAGAGRISLAANGYPQGLDSLLAAVWSETEGQDDLAWWKLTYDAQNGTFTGSFPLSALKHLGTCRIHIYARSTQGGMSFVSGTSAELGLREGTEISVSPGDTEETFWVTIRNLTGSVGIRGVSVPVWSEAGGQDDLIWHRAQLQEDGSYAVRISVADHGYQMGRYQIHVYGEMGPGLLGFAGSIGYDCSPLANQISISGQEEDASRWLILAYPSVLPARVAVWSEQGGQDDIHWLKFTDQGNGRWAAELTGCEYDHDGTFYAHVYADRFLCGTTFSWKTERDLVKVRTQEVLNQIGWDLKAAYDWSRSLRYDRNVGYPQNLPEGTLHSHYYAQWGFANKSGNCYAMAATFVYMARAMGYEAYFIEGQVPYDDGNYGVHGWCELILDGKLYVVDPDFEYDTGKSGYLITYGSSGTWRYANGVRVD